MIHWDELIIFSALGLGVALLGLVAARWRHADLAHLNEWGLAGRSFGSVITWFLLGGDLYTAYTFIAVPALVFGAGAAGLFAIPYTVIVYPMVFLLMPRLWQVARNRGHVTGSDYVKERFNSPFLALLIALTGIAATMPYIALQIFGIRVVIAQMGVNEELALAIAFVVLAGFTYVSGLRAPALIAVVKDTLIWATVIVAVIYIPSRLGGYGAIFSSVEHHTPKTPDVLPPAGYNGYWTLALGSAGALFLYPHAITGVFSASSQKVVRRNAAFLPAYSFLLGLIALLGFMAIAAGTKPATGFGNNGAVPQLFQDMFPGWFNGFAFAAIAIGALVPASVMSIGAANLFSRNIWKEFIRRDALPREEATVAKIGSLVVKGGALVFILVIPQTDVINFQLFGGILMLQALPAIVMALYLRWLDTWATVAGWAVGTVLGISAFAAESYKATSHDFGFGGKVYIGLVAMAANVVVTVVGSLITQALGRRSSGLLNEDDYHAHERGDIARTGSQPPLTAPAAGV